MLLALQSDLVHLEKLSFEKIHSKNYYNVAERVFVDYCYLGEKQVKQNLIMIAPLVESVTLDLKRCLKHLVTTFNVKQIRHYCFLRIGLEWFFRCHSKEFTSVVRKIANQFDMLLLQHCKSSLSLRK